MLRRLIPAVTIILAGVVAACGSSTTSTVVPSSAATPTPAATATAAPSVVPTLASAGPYDGQAYSLALPEGWLTFDMTDPAGQAALDAFVAANPEMAGSIEAFKSMKGLVMAVNQLLGNVVVSVAIPTGGLSLDVIAASFTSQFAGVPGVQEAPPPDDVTLPAGPAKHWHLVIEANNPSGGTYTVGESIYLVTNAATAVLVEFVEVGGTAVPQEQQIIRSLAFK